MMESKQIHSYQGNAGPRPYWSLEDEKSLGLGSGNQFVNAGSVQIPEMSMVKLFFRSRSQHKHCLFSSLI